MIRLFFYVEGQTEQAYVDRVLRNHLARFGVMVEGAILVSTGKKHGVVYRGGGRRYAPMKKDLHNLLRQHKGGDVRFTTMLDLYNLYRDCPGTVEADKLRHVPYERVKKLEIAIASDVGDQRLIPHIQLFEFETILFCEPDAFCVVLRKPRSRHRRTEEDFRGRQDAGVDRRRRTIGPKQAHRTAFR